MQVVAQSIGVSAATLERWRADALVNGKKTGGWTAVARLDAVVTTASMSEEEKNAWCRAAVGAATGCVGFIARRRRAGIGQQDTQVVGHDLGGEVLAIGVLGEAWRGVADQARARGLTRDLAGGGGEHCVNEQDFARSTRQRHYQGLPARCSGIAGMAGSHCRNTQFG